MIFHSLSLKLQHERSHPCLAVLNGCKISLFVRKIKEKTRFLIIIHHFAGWILLLPVCMMFHDGVDAIHMKKMNTPFHNAMFI